MDDSKSYLVELLTGGTRANSRSYLAELIEKVLAPTPDYLLENTKADIEIMLTLKDKEQRKRLFENHTQRLQKTKKYLREEHIRTPYPKMVDDFLRDFYDWIDGIDRLMIYAIKNGKLNREKYRDLQNTKEGLFNRWILLYRAENGHLEKIVKQAEKKMSEADLASTEQNGKEVKLQPKEPSKDALRDQVFICYSHKDDRWLNDLQTHLKPYVRNGSVTAWSDKQIVTGSKWLSEIEAALNSAKVAVLLVTPNFLASDFIHENELGPLLKKAEKGKVGIIWIPVRACSYKETPLKDYQAAGNPDKPLAIMKANRDDAWVKICEEIKKAVLEK